jgi:ubiquitin carboxyl-terminal hydrolase L3
VTAGQTRVRDEDWEECDHFLSFVHAKVDGELRNVEMDGNEPRTGPLDRGQASDSLLRVSHASNNRSPADTLPDNALMRQDVARVVQTKYLPNAGENMHFSMIALVG